MIDGIGSGHGRDVGELVRLTFPRRNQDLLDVQVQGAKEVARAIQLGRGHRLGVPQVLIIGEKILRAAHRRSSPRSGLGVKNFRNPNRSAGGLVR